MAVEVIKNKLSSPYSDSTRESLRNRIDFNRIVSNLVCIYIDLLKRKK